jgi:hypothetical protein
MESQEWREFIYILAFVDRMVQERRIFGSLRLVSPYEFNQSDFSASLLFCASQIVDSVKNIRLILKIHFIKLFEMQFQQFIMLGEL